MDNKDISTTAARLLTERQNKFIEARTITQREVQKFLTSIESIKPKLIEAGIVSLEGTTAQEILPAMWQEPFDVNAYAQQKEKFLNYVNEVVLFCDKLNEEALRCLQST